MPQDQVGLLVQVVQRVILAIPAQMAQLEQVEWQALLGSRDLQG